MATPLGSFTAGQILTEADLNDIGTWTDYTPTFASGVTVGNGTWNAAYCIVNEILFWQGTFTLGSTSAVTGAVTITLPESKSFPAANSELLGQVRMTAGGNTYYGSIREDTTTSVAVLVYLANSTYLLATGLSASVPGTWTNANNMQISYVARINP